METGSANIHKKLLSVIYLLIPIAFFSRLGSYQLIFEEPRRALVALEMLIADNWIVPTTNGVLYYNKPPLYNWILMVLMSTLGKAEWVIRLPTILSVFATALLHYRISRIYISEKAAILSALFYITSADILFFFSMLGEIDLFFALIVYIQSVLIFHFYQQKKWHWLYLSSYLLTSAGLLTKGIPSLFFQGITLLVIFTLNRDFKRLFSIWHLAGIILLVLTSGAYFYLYSLQSDVEPYLARLFTETFSRTSLQKNLVDEFKFLVKFPLMLIKISAPWFLLLFITSRSGWKTTFSNKFLRFCFWFCIANGSLYLLSPGTRERYLYMFFPFIYALLANAVCNPDRIIWLKRFYIFIAILVITGLFGLGAFGFTNNTILPPIICVVLALSVTIAFYHFRLKDSFSLLLAAIMFILLARVAFDLVILPTRKKDVPYNTDAKQMSRLIGNDQIYFLGPSESRTDRVEFAGKHFSSFTRNEPVTGAFQTSFYLSRYTGKIVKYTTNKHLNGFFISPEELVNTQEINVYYRFNIRIKSEKHWYLLYRNKNL